MFRQLRYGFKDNQILNGNIVVTLMCTQPVNAVILTRLEGRKREIGSLYLSPEMNHTWIPCVYWMDRNESVWGPKISSTDQSSLSSQGSMPTTAGTRGALQFPHSTHAGALKNHLPDHPLRTAQKVRSSIKAVGLQSNLESVRHKIGYWSVCVHGPRWDGHADTLTNNKRLSNGFTRQCLYL